MALVTNWYFIVTQILHQTHDTHKHMKRNRSNNYSNILKNRKFGIIRKKNQKNILILKKIRKKN
jgi:hypothetical protein